MSVQHWAGAGLRRGVVLVLVAIAVAGCSPLGPSSGMGAHFVEPEMALSDALGPTGWLGPFARPVFHTQERIDRRHVVLFSAYPPGSSEPALGVADARRGWRGWYAHGRLGPFDLPETGEGLLSCAMVELPSSDGRFVVFGRVPGARIEAVEVVLEDGKIARAATRDGVFGALMESGARVTEIRGVGAAGDAVARMAADECAV